MAITKATASSIAPAAKGDLVVGSATNDAAVLAVGSANQVLTVDSSTTSGLKWATPSAGSMTLLSTTTLPTSGSIAIVTVDSIEQTYTDLIIYVYGISSSASAEYLFGVRNNTTMLPNSMAGITQGGATQIDNSASPWTPSSGTLSTNANNYHTIKVSNYASTTTYKPVEFYGGFSTRTNRYNFAGVITSTSAINSFYLEDITAFFRGGTILIYGVK